MVATWNGALFSAATIRQPVSTLSRHPDESTTTVIQPGDKCKAKASSGLEVPPAATFSTCV
ncbi:hypothetical protein ECTHUN299_52700 [Escherichia coli]|nr:hypothetical protein ECTHUN299_52700 [Escherichia coli]